MNTRHLVADTFWTKARAQHPTLSYTTECGRLGTHVDYPDRLVFVGLDGAPVTVFQPTTDRSGAEAFLTRYSHGLRSDNTVYQRA